MFGDEILNATQLMKRLNISGVTLYRLIDDGLPFHRLSKGSRRYYVYSEVRQWILSQGLGVK